MVFAPTAAGASPVSIVHFTALVSNTNEVTLDWQVRGGDSSGTLNISGVGVQPQTCPVRQAVGCSTSLRVANAGVFRYTLSVHNDARQVARSTIEVSVKPPPPPSTPSPRVDVDMLNIHSQTLSWSHDGSGFVEIFPPDSARPYGRRFPPTGTFAVRTSSLPIGRSTFYVSYCVDPPLNKVPFCSAGTPVTYAVGPAEFSGPYRKFVPADQNLRLSWSGSGNAWLLNAPTLGITKWLTSPSFTIPAADVTAGVHEISVVSCSLQASTDRCSNRFDVISTVAGTVRFTVASGAGVGAGQSVGTLTPDRGGDAEILTAPRDGTFRRLASNEAHLSAHTAAGMVVTANVGRTEVVAGGGASVPTWTTTPWENAFTARTYNDSVRPSTGDPLDVTFDSTGDIWQVGEFSQAIAHVHNGTLTDSVSPVGQALHRTAGADAPLAHAGAAIAQVQDGSLTKHDSSIVRTPNSAPRIPGPLRPYAIRMFGIDSPTSTSVLGERVIDTGSAVWYTQGGELFYDGIHPNHSTLIKVDYRGHDNPTDDPVCAIDVPGDNNQVIGIAYDPTTNRVWFTESHAGHGSALDWFVDNGSIPCDNHLNYSNPSDVAAVSAANHCTVATETGCIHQIDLPTTAGLAGHITIDTFSGYAWFVDFTGRELDRYPLKGGAVQSFPLPKSVSSSLFNGFPWEIQADANAVYLNEYSDNTLLRFDKTIANPTTRCATLTDGKNPCISELFLPMAGPDTNAHSIALVGNKLWFTIANESNGPTDPNGSTFGYIDTTSWAAGTPTGTYFDNLTTLGTPLPNAHQCFRGIAVTAAGNIALADSGYDQIVSLTPK
ncbi:MAG: hypothetical protein ACLPVY_23725 [Acidimicrobiia bacterium]